MTRRLVPLLVVAATAIAAAAHAATPVGKVSRHQGDSVGVSEGTERTLATGAVVHLQEEISTGDAARLELTFDDGTVLTLGEQARLVIDEFVYNPADGLERMAVSANGAFRFVSAALTRADSEISVATPVALLGVRGTDFWGGPIDGAFGVFLLEGSVTVTNAAGEALLDETGEGVNLDGPDVAPGEVTVWPQDKVDRAFATVTFN